MIVSQATANAPTNSSRADQSARLRNRTQPHTAMVASAISPITAACIGLRFSQTPPSISESRPHVSRKWGACDQIAAVSPARMPAIASHSRRNSFLDSASLRLSHLRNATPAGIA